MRTGTRALEALATGLASPAISQRPHHYTARKAQAPPMRAYSIRHGCLLSRVPATPRRPLLGLEKGPISYQTEKRMYNIKPSSRPLSLLYYLFSPFLYPMSAPRYAFTVLNLSFFCASMILDDCLMTITPSSSHSASDVDLSQPLPTYKSSFTNSFAVHNFLLPCWLELRSCISSSSLLVASSVCSLIYLSCSSSQRHLPLPWALLHRIHSPRCSPSSCRYII